MFSYTKYCLEENKKNKYLLKKCLTIEIYINIKFRDYFNNNLKIIKKIFNILDVKNQ